jgi:hypothetical protein
MVQTGKLVFGVLALSLGIGLVAFHSKAADDKGSAVPDEDYAKLVAQSSKVIKDALAGEEPTLKDATKAKTAAVMIAACAQTGPMSPQRATMRDAALKLAEALEKAKDSGKFDDARKQADELANLKPDASAKTTPVTPLIEKHIYIEELMSQFKIPRAGGLEIEKKLINLGSTGLRTKMLPPEAMDDQVLIMAYQTALAGKLTQEHKPDDNVKTWLKYAETMEKSAQELAVAVKAKNGKEAFIAINKLNDSCKNCHDDFR